MPQVLILVAVPLLAAALYGALLIRHVTKPWPERRDVEPAPAPEPMMKCRGCGAAYHPSWNETTVMMGESLDGVGPCCTGAD